MKSLNISEKEEKEEEEGGKFFGDNHLHKLSMVEFSFDESLLNYIPKYQIFHSLMKRRIKEILLVSSAYDNFILEEDGRLSDQIYAEFHDLNLRTLPHITRVASAEEALKRLKKNEFDLVVTMRRLFDTDPFEFGKQIKDIQDIPVVLLLTSLSDINFIPDFSKSKEGIDLTFLWNGDSAIFISLTKLLEDRMNIKADTLENGMARVIIIIEDNIRFYSVYLPHIYGEIMRQTKLLIHEGVNDYYRLSQMKARPKIILTHTYEDAMEFYTLYKDYVIGIIADVKFPRNDRVDRNAGIDFIKTVRENNPTIPAILQSSNQDYQQRAEKIKAHFIHKQSKTLLEDIRQFMVRYMGFGDFVFRLENGEEVGKASNLREFCDQIKKVPLESLRYHASNDNFSGWLMARGEFRIAQIIKLQYYDDFESKELLRDFLLESVQQILDQQKNVVTDFRRVNYNPDSNFMRLRPGSLGGKGRGLAFLLFLANPYDMPKIMPSVEIKIPQTIAIGTDAFDAFMTANKLYEIASTNDISEEELFQVFRKAKLARNLRNDLKFILKDWHNHPIAVRSSSIVEDSQFQPFAGVFGTYMISNQEKDLNSRLNRVFEAIKMVYASTFSRTAKANSEALDLRIDEIKMGVIIQKVVGKKYEASNHFYPNFSGTASSFNYYPVGKMEARDGIAFLALGLGRQIVNGGLARMFCPSFPRLNVFSVKELIQNSQTDYFAIDLSKKAKNIADEESYLSKLTIADAKNDGTLDRIADSYNHNDNIMQSGYWDEDHLHPVITFNQQIRYDKKFPMAKIIQQILKLGEKSMGCPVEIEFAGNFSRNKHERNSLYLLQIRPSTEIPIKDLGELDDIEKKDILARASTFSGNAVIRNIRDIVYIKGSAFTKLKTVEMASEIDALNKKLTAANKPYLLIVFGRLGSYDKFVGIPVREFNITGAKVIIETGQENFQIEQSQGTHFFQNMVSTKTGFLHIKYNSKTAFIDWDWLKTQKIAEEKQFFIHTELANPLTIILDGRSKKAVIKKPEKG